MLPCLSHGVLLQSLLTAAGLPEVTGAQSKLVALTAALQAELAARQAAMSTLSAELSRQVRLCRETAATLGAGGVHLLV